MPPPINEQMKAFEAWCKETDVPPVTEGDPDEIMQIRLKLWECFSAGYEAGAKAKEA